MFVKMGSDMPFMQSKIDPKTMKLLVDEENAEEIQQRAPDWTRQPALTAYLIHNSTRKFGTILAVISPPWVDQPEHENWGKDGRALKSAVSFRALDSSGLIGVLDLNSTHIYALDGQHRVMGVRGVKDLQEGHIVLKKRDGAHTQKKYSRDEFLSVFHSDIGHLQKVLNERMTVEYIPAVLAGETRKEATQRVRSVFVAINSYAKRPDKGENILLDESDGYAITARAIGVHHSLMKSSKGESRVNWKNTSLPKGSTWYTTLQALKDMAENYLKEINPKLDDDWQPKFSGQVPIRPEEKDLEYAREKYSELWNYIASIPVFKGLESGDKLQNVREFPPEGENGHILVRPIGQTMLASVVGRLVSKGMTLDEIFEKINKLDKLGGFEAHRPENIWWGVTYSSTKKTMIASTSHQEFAATLLEYMLRGAEEPERSKLRTDLMGYRTSPEGNVMSFDGEWLKNKDDFDLPVPVK
jgi:hypothetical protein